MLKLPDSAPVCWIFCTVIDNFGDMGVCWRLANMLQRELGWSVVLWTDDETALRALSPDMPLLPTVWNGMVVRHWHAGVLADGWQALPQPDVVIEAFACDLPPDVREMMRFRQPLWLNWEYLSAEDWAEAMHLKPSPQGDGTQKYFWLMGFNECSGGLLRENDYAERCLKSVQRETFGLPEKRGTEWLVFGYQNGPWREWLHMWQQSGEEITLYLAGGQVLASLQQQGCVPRDVLGRDGEMFQAANVRLVRLPFVPQESFDALLSLFDGAIVRGEDSFVRAQLGGKPFLWHIYPQEEQAHVDKLHAFWQRCRTFYSEDCFSALQRLSDDLNGAQTLKPQERLQAWQQLRAVQAAWSRAAADWAEYLHKQSSAMARLQRFWLST